MEVVAAGHRGLLPGPGSRALDVSSGVGRNALFLLKRGLDVRSIVYPDASGAQLAFQRKWAGRYRQTCPGTGSIDVVPGEFARYDLGDHPVDLVVCVNSLMYAPLAIGREAILHWQRQTRAGGLHLITTYTIEDGYHGRASVSDGTFVTSGRPEDDELQRLYPATDWEHLGSSSRSVSTTKDSRSRRRARSVIIARKRAIPSAGR
ncbi:MAG: class I SAM-dependent methyltransferase [Planctomycetia bacterium]